MSHHDHDGDSELAELILWVLFFDDGKPNWFTISVFILALGLLGWHYFG